MRINERYNLDNLFNKIAFLIFILLDSFILFYNINEPWWGVHDINGAFFATMIKNALLSNNYSDLLRYWNHPPGAQFIFYISARIFGLNEGTIRLIPSIFSLLSFCIFYIIICKRLSRTNIILSSIVYIFSPLNSYFGRNPVHEPILGFFILCSFLFLLKWIETRESKYLFSQLIAILLGSWIDWPAFYMIPITIVTINLFNEKDKRFNIELFYSITLVIFTISSFCLIFILYSSYYNVSIYEVVNQVKSAGSFRSNLLLYISPFWYSTMIEYFRQSFTDFIFVSLSFFILNKIRNSFNSTLINFKDILKRIRNVNSIWLFFYLSFIFGSLHVLIFPSGALYHQYWIYYLLPSMSLLIGNYLDKLINLRLSNKFEIKKSQINCNKISTISASLILILLLSHSSIKIHTNENRTMLDAVDFVNKTVTENSTVVISIPMMQYYLECKVKIILHKNLDEEWIYLVNNSAYSAFVIIIEDLSSKIMDISLDYNLSIKIIGNNIIYYRE